MRAPIAANLDSMLFAFIRFNLRTRTRRSEHQVPLCCGSDSNNSIWFIALAKEQRSLVIDSGSHEVSFGCWFSLAEGVGNAPTSAVPILFSRQVQPAYICLPSKIGCQGWTRTNTVRFNKPSCYFDTTWQWEIGAAGKTRTCIGSFRRRMPLYLGHGSIGKWSARQDLHLRSLGPKPSALAATLRAGKWRIRRGSHPQPSRRQRVAPLIELRIRNGGGCW